MPGIAERIAFGTLKSDEYFMLFNKKNADLVDLVRRNNVGGPAIIFDRHQEAGFKTDSFILSQFRWTFIGRYALKI